MYGSSYTTECCTFFLMFCVILPQEIMSISKNETKEVCYGSLGCFDLGVPFSSPLRPMPNPLSPSEIGLEIFMYVRPNITTQWNVTVYPHVKLNGAPFNKKLPSYFITHGLSSNGHKDWVQGIKNGILMHTDANVFVVNWAKGSNNVKFVQAVSNTVVVGRGIGIFIVHLIRLQSKETNNEKRALGFPKLNIFKLFKRRASTRENTIKDRAHDITLIGHSLGGQVIGYTAKYVQTQLHHKVGEIIALDPTQIFYEFFPSDLRITKHDAVRVILVHTTSVPVAMGGMGMMAPAGHCDFYMNGGFNQPGCQVPNISAMANVKSPLDLINFSVEQIKDMYTCPHGRAHAYFKEAVLNPNCTFWGHKVSAGKIINAIHNLKTNGVWAPLNDVNAGCTHQTCVKLGLYARDYLHHGSFIIYTAGAASFCIPEDTILGISNSKKKSEEFNSQKTITEEMYKKRIKELEDERDKKHGEIVKIF